ncbi:MAG: hypothetical protein KKH74_08940 [Gammaproteobacteria bacterium]|nr:hypothetical protein [Gammaproteobacteria bacterium]MBU1732635.1 hypothetical protein [Gammaproteobacteria bacterium]MBU1893498.1 hypothetical protein [Gammaproteobacteria bacterium]
MFDKIEKIAVKHYLCALESSATEDSLFRTLMNVDMDGSMKPLLVVGVTHPWFYDGFFIAVLNPDISLISKINPGCGSSDFILKEIVSKKCDLMLSSWVYTYKGFKVSRSTTYKSRNPCSARFPFQKLQLEGALNRP